MKWRENQFEHGLYARYSLSIVCLQDTVWLWAWFICNIQFEHGLYARYSLSIVCLQDTVWMWFVCRLKFECGLCSGYSLSVVCVQDTVWAWLYAGYGLSMVCVWNTVWAWFVCRIRRWMYGAELVRLPKPWELDDETQTTCRQFLNCHIYTCRTQICRDGWYVALGIVSLCCKHTSNVSAVFIHFRRVVSVSAALKNSPVINVLLDCARSYTSCLEGWDVVYAAGNTCMSVHCLWLSEDTEGRCWGSSIWR